MPGPHRGGNFKKMKWLLYLKKQQWPRRKFLRCRSHEVFKLCGASRNGKIGCGWWQRQGMSESMHSSLNEPMNLGFNESMNQCNESTKHWINVSINHTQSGKSAHRLFKNNHDGTLRIQEVTEASAKLCKSAWEAVRQQSSISFNVRCFLWH